MAYRYRSRSAKRIAKKSKRNLLITIVLIVCLLYATINWILPSFINVVGEVNSIVKQPTEAKDSEQLNSTLAPPILNIPYEATNTSEINIGGYANPDSSVKIFVDEKEVTTVSALEDGSFLASDISLSYGTNSIYGKTIDEEGRESLPSKTIKIIFDNEKPPLSINEPEDNRQVQGERKLKISGKTEPNAQVFVNESQVIVDQDGNFSTELQLIDGDNNFNIKAVDKASNSEEASRRVIFQP